jgi:hypothetical protein
LQKVGTVDGEQGLAFLHLIANGREKPDDPALIRGEDLNRHFLIEINAADCAPLDRKDIFLHRLDPHRGQLRVGKVHAVGGWTVGRPGRRRSVGLLSVGLRVGLRAGIAKSRARPIVVDCAICADGNEQYGCCRAGNDESALILLVFHGVRFDGAFPKRCHHGRCTALVYCNK